MIRFLQSGKNKYILSGLLLVICGSMVVYLIPGFLSTADATSRTGTVATVAGESIRTEDVTRLVQNQLRQGRVPDFYVPIMTQQILQQLVQLKEERYEAGRLGLSVTNEEVQDELQHGRYKDVFYPDGKWIGKEKYEELLTQGGTTAADFENATRDELLDRKLFNTVSAAVSVSPADVDHTFKERNTRVKFQYAVLNLADIQKEITPTDAELKAFYETNKRTYVNSIPEKRQIRYFVLNDKDVESKVTVDAGDLQRYYAANKDHFALPERVKVRHILISTPPAGADGKVDQKGVDEARAKAADILKQIRAGGNFAELAKKYSQDPGSATNGGELGWVLRGKTVPEFEKTAFGQNPGQVSDLVQTSYGFHIIQTEEKESARLKPLAEVKGEIETLVRADKASALLDRERAAAEATALKQGLDKAAALSGAPVILSNPMNRGDLLPGIGPSPELSSMVFAGTEKSGPQVARYSQGYVIFEIAKIMPAATPSFEEIRDRVATEFKNQRGNDLLIKRTKEMADRAHAQHDLAKAAKEAGATVKTSELLTSNSQSPDLGSMSGPPSVAFTLKPGEISGPLSLGEKGAVLQVIDRQEPSLTDGQFAKEREGIEEELAGKKRNEAWQLFLSNLGNRLEKEGKVKLNKAEINNLIRSRS
jgi:peptidyl-prolyl cis-trans isomerase D